jgi:hypothetical protein
MPKRSRFEMELHRCEIAALMLGAAAALGAVASADAQSDPLPSWNAGSAKDAILAFVRATTVASSPNFVPLEQRIATFDQDGTLWLEHPIYTQVVFCFDRVPRSGVASRGGKGGVNILLDTYPKLFLIKTLRGGRPSG